MRALRTALAATAAVLAMASPSAAENTPPATPTSTSTVPVATGTTSTTAPVVPPPETAPPDFTGPETGVGGPPAGTTTTVPGADLPGRDKPGFFDFVGRAVEGINNWFRSLAEDSLGPVFRLLGRTIFATPDLTSSAPVRGLWRVSWGIANSVFILFVVVGGAIAMSHETLQTRYTVKELVPRIVVAWVAANASLVFVGLAISTADALSEAFTAHSRVDAFTLLLGLVTRAMAGGGIFSVLLSLGVVVLGLALLATYVVRISTLIVLTAGGPLFLATHALPQTEGMARLWWRAVFGCLAVQVGQTLVFVAAVQVYFDPGGLRSALFAGGSLMDMLVVLALFWLMVKLPTYARQVVFSARSNLAGQVAKTYVVREGIKAAKTAVKAAVAA